MIYTCISILVSGVDNLPTKNEKGLPIINQEEANDTESQFQLAYKVITVKVLSLSSNDPFPYVVDKESIW